MPLPGGAEMTVTLPSAPRSTASTRAGRRTISCKAQALRSAQPDRIDTGERVVKLLHRNDVYRSLAVSYRFASEHDE